MHDSVSFTWAPACQDSWRGQLNLGATDQGAGQPIPYPFRSQTVLPHSWCQSPCPARPFLKVTGEGPGILFRRQPCLLHLSPPMPLCSPHSTLSTTEGHRSWLIRTRHESCLVPVLSGHHHLQPALFPWGQLGLAASTIHP